MNIYLLQVVKGKGMEGKEAFNQTLLYDGYFRYSEAPSRFTMPTAHTEGWGLYSEFLGFELGLYEDLYARFGHYSFNLVRACRLVVDTGMHAMGWSREQAVNYMLENTASSKDTVETEIDRYITWPGQACAYKIGERNIKSLRSAAEQQLGDKFSIAEFHRAVLQCSGPMSALETCIERFVSAVLSKEDNSPVVQSGGDRTLGGVGALVLRVGWALITVRHTIIL